MAAVPKHYNSKGLAPVNTHVKLVTRGRFISLQQLVMARGDERSITEDEFRSCYDRAWALDMCARADDGPELVNYRPDWLDVFQRVVQYEVGQGRSSPITVWAVFAEIYHTTVAVWEPAGDGTYFITTVDDTPLVFSPTGMTETGGKHMDVLWCNAADPSARLKTNPSGGRPGFDGPEGNHFMLL